MQRMSDARDESDDLESITFGQELRCGMDGCGAPTTTGLLERDESLPGLWRLLPVCKECLTGLRAGGRIPPTMPDTDDARDGGSRRRLASQRRRH